MCETALAPVPVGAAGWTVYAASSADDAHGELDVKLTFALATAALYAASAFTSSAWAGAAEDIMAKAKCNKCHTATTTKKGPSYADVAAKYKGKPDPTAAMIDMLKTGGKDDHDKVKASDADLKAIIALVLASK